jgi:hypothetical protein
MPTSACQSNSQLSGIFAFFARQDQATGDQEQQGE